MALVCRNCGKTFEPKWSTHRKRAKFCTIKCASQWNAKDRPGRSKTTKGYISLHMPHHPHASKQGRVMEHRVVMEQELDRILTPDEVVHHKNGIKDDNRPENLEVMTKQRHDKRSKRPPRLMPCPHCQEPIAVRNPRHGAGGVTLSLPESPQ